jgi:sporulation protein YqfC
MKKSKQKRQGGLRERFCHSLDIHPDVLPAETLIELRGKSSVSIKGAGRVSVYTDTEIRLLSKNGDICVRGSNLLCSAYRRGAVTVDGKIESVSFEEVRR